MRVPWIHMILTLSHTGGIFPSTARGGVNLTRTYLTAAEGTIRHILCIIIEGTMRKKIDWVIAIFEPSQFFFSGEQKSAGHQSGT